MLKKLKLLIVSALAFGLFLAPAVAMAGPAPDGASTEPNIRDSLCSGANTLQLGQDDSDCSDVDADDEGLNALIAKVINIVSVIVAIVAVIMIIVGGFKYIASGGDSGKVTGAKNTILYAVIGLIIVAVAQFVVKFVLGQASTLVN